MRVYKHCSDSFKQRFQSHLISISLQTHAVNATYW